MAQPTMEDAKQWLKDHEEERSPARATVYSDGKDATIFYSWQTQQAPPKDWKHAGTLFVVPQDKSWKAKARTTDAKWQAVMEQALPLFEAEVRKLISELNKGGLSLADLPEFIKLANDPEKMKALEEKSEQ
jgi:hypothetical protein